MMNLERYMNKKAEDKLLSIWWIFILAMIGVGIVGGVFIYFSADVSVKHMEADILSERLIDCFVDGDKLDRRVFEENFDVFSFCGLDPKVFDKGSDFYFNVTVVMGFLSLEISEGDSSFEKDCDFWKKTTAKHFPKCVRKKEKAYLDGGNADLTVLTGSNQVGERI